MYLRGLMQCPVWRQSSINDSFVVSNFLVRGLKNFTNILEALGRRAQVLRLYTHWVGNVGMSVTTRQSTEWQGPCYIMPGEVRGLEAFSSSASTVPGGDD